MQIVTDMWKPASLFVVFDVPGASLWGGDRLGRRTPYRGVPDKKGLWKTRLEAFFFDALQIALGDGFREATGDALSTEYY
jgi:hypothetical protein